MAECLLAVRVQCKSAVKELQRAVSWRDERNLGADVVAASLEGGIGIVRVALARAERQIDVRGAHEVRSFALMHTTSRDVERSDDFCDG